MVFAYPGFGRMLLDASMFGDIATLEAATLVTVSSRSSRSFLATSDTCFSIPASGEVTHVIS